jgi:hypothetical protein
MRKLFDMAFCRDREKRICGAQAAGATSPVHILFNTLLENLPRFMYKKANMDPPERGEGEKQRPSRGPGEAHRRRAEPGGRHRRPGSGDAGSAPETESMKLFREDIQRIINVEI